MGGCVWTAEDLEKDPSAWERREVPWNQEMAPEAWLGKVGALVYQGGFHIIPIATLYSRYIHMYLMIFNDMYIYIYICIYICIYIYIHIYTCISCI